MSFAQAEAGTRRETRRHLIEFIFSSTNRMDNDAIIRVAKIDPDLSISHEVAQELLKKTYMERPQVLQKEMIHSMIRAGQTLMISEWSTVENEISPRKTRNHVRALKHIIDITGKVQDATIQEGMQNSLLTLFAYATTPRRRDLVKHPEFPWKEAIDQALNTPFELMYRRFGKRFVILQDAPTDVLADRALEFAKTHEGGVPMILYDEFLQWRDVDYLQDKRFYDLMAAMPTGDKQTAWGVLEWAFKVTSAATDMERENYNERIPEAFVHMLWDALEKQWRGLSYEDQNTFLHAGILIYADDLWHKNETTLKTSPLARSYEFVHAVLASLSQEGHELLVQNYDLMFQEYPALPVPSVLFEVLPDVAARIEERRPKK